MSLTLIFWGAPWFSDFASHSPEQEPLVTKLWGVCRAMPCLTRTCQGAAERGGIPEGAQYHGMAPRQFSFLSCSQAGHAKPRCGVSAFWRTKALHSWRKQRLLWAHAPSPWDALHQLCQKQQQWQWSGQPQWYQPSLAAVSLRCRMEKPSANASLAGSKVWMHFYSGITISVPSWPLVLPANLCKKSSSLQ